MSKWILVFLLSVLSACVAPPKSYETTAELDIVKDMKIIPEAPELDAISLEEQVQEEIKTPIQFYIRVQDITGEPIVGLPVEIATLNRALNPFSYPYFGWELIPNIYTDKRGEIALQTEGAALFVNVDSEDYWRERGFTGLIYYAPRLQSLNEREPPIDKKKPFLVILKNKPDEAHTVPISTGAIRIKNGELASISLRNKQRYQSEQGDINVLISKPEALTGEPYPWSVTINVPGGGIQKVSQLPNVRAPKTGYSESFTFSMLENTSDWDHRKSFYFYIKTADNLFALTEFRIRTSPQPFIVLEGVYNPHGSDIVR